MTGIEFEDVLFQQLLHYSNVTFIIADLAGKSRIPLHIKFNYFKILQNPPEQITDDDILFRYYKRYPHYLFSDKYLFKYQSPILLQITLNQQILKRLYK
jgi:hypothetical protein